MGISRFEENENPTSEKALKSTYLSEKALKSTYLSEKARVKQKVSILGKF